MSNVRANHRIEHLIRTQYSSFNVVRYYCAPSRNRFHFAMRLSGFDFHPDQLFVNQTAACSWLYFSSPSVRARQIEMVSAHRKEKYYSIWHICTFSISHLSDNHTASRRRRRRRRASEQRLCITQYCASTNISTCIFMRNSTQQPCRNIQAIASSSTLPPSSSSYSSRRIERMPFIQHICLQAIRARHATETFKSA